MSWATRRAGGFTDQDIARLAAINRPFARIIEIMALHRLCTTLLDTYVGHGSGERVLKGAIRPGDVQRIEAAILVSDMRGFTAFSNAHPPEQVIERLNAVFGCIMPAVEAEGGEVLKLIGDGLLAIFPLAEREPGEVCAAALRAAETATRAVAALDLTPPARCGMALHVGEVSYGNIGAGNRLDFTAIGPAVNLAARLEPLNAQLGRDLLVSGTFAGLVDAALEPLGHLFAARLSRAGGGLRAGGMNQVNHVRCAQRGGGLAVRPLGQGALPGTGLRPAAEAVPHRPVPARRQADRGQRAPGAGPAGPRAALGRPAAPRRPRPAKRQLRPEDAALIRSLIVYQDERLIALNKPAGLAVQGGSGTTRHVDGLLDALAKKGERPKLVHRLDRDTSGLMVVAKSAAAARELAFAFQQHKVRKLYWAILLKGPERNQGLIDLPLAKAGPAGQEKMRHLDHEDDAEGAGRNARTRFMVLARAGKVAAWTGADAAHRPHPPAARARGR